MAVILKSIHNIYNICKSVTPNPFVYKTFVAAGVNFCKV